MVTREMVYEWLSSFKESKKKDLRAFLEDKLGDAKALTVDTHARDGRNATTPLIDLILDDIDTYA